MEADMYTDIIWQNDPYMSHLRSRIEDAHNEQIRAGTSTSALLGGEMRAPLFTSAGIYKTLTELFCLQDFLITNT